MKTASPMASEKTKKTSTSRRIPQKVPLLYFIVRQLFELAVSGA